MMRFSESLDARLAAPRRAFRQPGLLVLAILTFAATPVFGQPAASGGGAGESGDDSDEKSIEEILETSDRIDGLFTLYRDRKSGDLRMLLSPGQLDKTYLYFTYSENGVTAAGRYRGNFGMNRAKVFRISRFFDRVEFIVENTNFWFDSDKAISRAADANISHAVAADVEIEAENEDDGTILIDANNLFLTEAFNAVAPLPNPERPAHESFRIGSLDSSKTKIREIRNYPENTDVIVEYVYKNEQAYVGGGAEVTDARFVSLLVQHSLIEAPENNFEPRFDDPRVGYFTDRVTDLSSTDLTPYRDSIHRWNLVKRDPSAAISEPVEPIVYWIENTTPVELRPIIEAAALRWNEAFESAGFRNAIEVRVQPDDADWDAGDLRYNVIRWTSSPNPPFSGYGPSFADPRTGQMLGADIMLEHAVIGSNLREATVLGEATLAENELSLDPTVCMAGSVAHQEMLFASAALEALGADGEEQERLLEEFIHFLVLHEIGHTLGLNHNFRASHLHGLDAIFDPDATYPVGLHGSVMDYPAVPFALPGETHGQFYTTRPGPYDHWAINFGYSEALADPADEVARLDTILSRSTEPALAFGNDADDMRSPGKAIDPRAMIYDLTSDPIGFAGHQIDVVNEAVAGFSDRLLQDGDSYQKLLNAFSLAANRYGRAAAVASRFIGGVYVDRAMVNQAGARDPLTPVSLEDQLRAMQLLRDTVFAPDAF
ncbi:MAG: zinc-dependent metalloprotease, partial [Gammaproteobacteria bacterium]